MPRDCNPRLKRSEALVQVLADQPMIEKTISIEELFTPVPGTIGSVTLAAKARSIDGSET
jgi:hypothetical protein